MRKRLFGFFRSFLLLGIFLLSLGSATPSFGQANRASITGTVTDASGALMAGVEVTARNIGTSIETTSITNPVGNYLIPNLPPGTYALTFRKTGFKEMVQPEVRLVSTQVAGINVAMQVGAVTENITVTVGAPLLDTESTAIGTSITKEVAEELPLPIFNGGRFVENFALAIAPGYSPYSSIYGAVVNGTQWFSKDYTIDGTSGTASIRGNSQASGPSMEAVQELQTQTSGLDAGSAITNGGVISFTLKSGTNQFHGSTFVYGQNELLAANTWTNDLTGAPKTKRRAWDGGASIGGPILKDKLFFFGAFERYTQNNFTLGNYSGFVPTADMLSGNFSALLGSNLCKDSTGTLGTCGQSNGSGGMFSTVVNVQNKAGQTVPLQAGMIFDPATCTSMRQNCKQFTGNIIDTPISTVAQKINAVYKKFYPPERNDLTANNRFVGEGVPSQIATQPVVKLDYDFRRQDRLSASWIYNDRPNLKADSGGIWQQGSTDGGPLSTVRRETVKSNQIRLSEAHTFSSSLINILNLTYNWYEQGDRPSVTSDWNSQLGFGNTGSGNFPDISFGGAINGFNVTPIGSILPKSFAGATALTQDTVTWTTGRHSFSFGGDFRAYQVNSHQAQGGALNFGFVPNTTDGGFTSVAGFGFASYLLGDVATAGESTPVDLYGRRKAMSLFAQDSYKVTPKLTLTAGLRWQYAWRYHEKFGHWANYDLNQIDPKYGFPGKLVFANGGGDSFEKKEYWDGLGPQIGFAYAPAKKWVVRGSFSLALLPPSEPYFNGVPDGFAPGFQGTNTVPNAFNWDSGYPGKFMPGNKNVDPSTIFGLAYVDPHALMPGFSDTFNIGVQYELANNLRVEVAYVGNRGHHLPDTALAWNESSAAKFLSVEKANPGLVPYGDFSSWNFSGTGCTKGGGVPSGFGFGAPYVGITCPYDGFTGPALAALAPSPQLANWSTATWFFYDLQYVGLPIAQSSYNSMVVDLVKRTGRGWSMDLNYTYSRSRGDSFSNQQEVNSFYTPVQDFANVGAAANSLTTYDLTHVVKGYFLYELPFGRGKRWLSDKGGFVNGLVGGWQLAGLVGYNSGQPIQIGVSSPFYPIWGNFYPNFHPTGVDGPFKLSGYNAAKAASDSTYVFNYFSSSVASSPINGNSVSFGSGGLTDSALRCPGQANENVTLIKGLSFGPDGRYQLAMRVEFYNLFNRHYYVIQGCGGTGSTTVGPVGTFEKNFAKVLGVQDNPRTGQFGLRFTF